MTSQPIDESGHPNPHEEIEPLRTNPETPANEEADDFELLRADIDRFRDLALRSQADLDNYRKRSAREKEEAIRYANAGLLEHLIPILDNFELGLAAARSDSPENPILQGLAMVRKQLDEFLRAHGVEPVEAEGSPFDPNLHEAIAHEHDPNAPEGTVVKQIRRGYKLRDRLLRPANVVVSKGPAQ